MKIRVPEADIPSTTMIYACEISEQSEGEQVAMIRAFCSELAQPCGWGSHMFKVLLAPCEGNGIGGVSNVQHRIGCFDAFGNAPRQK
jgi:hypothetical protein